MKVVPSSLVTVLPSPPVTAAVFGWELVGGVATLARAACTGAMVRVAVGRMMGTAAAEHGHHDDDGEDDPRAYPHARPPVEGSLGGVGVGRVAVVGFRLGPGRGGEGGAGLEEGRRGESGVSLGYADGWRGAGVEIMVIVALRAAEGAVGVVCRLRSWNAVERHSSPEGL